MSLMSEEAMASNRKIWLLISVVSLHKASSTGEVTLVTPVLPNSSSRRTAKIS